MRVRSQRSERHSPVALRKMTPGTGTGAWNFTSPRFRLWSHRYFEFTVMPEFQMFQKSRYVVSINAPLTIPKARLARSLDLPLVRMMGLYRLDVGEGSTSMPTFEKMPVSSSRSCVVLHCRYVITLPG